MPTKKVEADHASYRYIKFTNLETVHYTVYAYLHSKTSYHQLQQAVDLHEETRHQQLRQAVDLHKEARHRQLRQAVDMDEVMRHRQLRQAVDLYEEMRLVRTLKFSLCIENLLLMSHLLHTQIS